MWGSTVRTLGFGFKRAPRYGALEVGVIRPNSRICGSTVRALGSGVIESAHCKSGALLC